MGLLLIPDTDYRAQRYVSDLLRIAGGQVSVRKLRQEWRKVFPCDPQILTDEQVAKLPVKKVPGAFPIKKGKVRFPERRVRLIRKVVA